MSSHSEERLRSNVFKLKSRLARFKKNDLLTQIPNMFPNIKHELPENIHSFSKRSIVNYFSESLLDLVDSDMEMNLIVFQVDLKFVQEYSNKKMWKIFKLIDIKEGFNAESLYDPEYFADCLSRNLSRSKFDCKVRSEFHQEGIWTVVSLEPILSRRKRDPTYKFFLIHYPHLPYMLHSDVKLPILLLLKTALCLAFECRKLKTLKLSSKNVGTVLQLALQKDGCKFDKGPMPAIIEAHHKPIAEVPLVEIPNLIDEEDALSSNTNYMTKLYGKCQQPPLESLTIRIESSINEETELTAKCQIVSSGKNVMEGLRSLVQKNIIRKPLHFSLERLPQLGCNEIFLTEN